MCHMHKTTGTIIFILFLVVSACSISFADDLDPHYKSSGVKARPKNEKNEKNITKKTIWRATLYLFEPVGVSY